MTISDNYRRRHFFMRGISTLEASHPRSKTIIGWWQIIVVAVAMTSSVMAAPFAKQIQFEQPDGSSIVLWGEGDEFHAVFETLDGYTVIFNPATKAYDYAQLSKNGENLVSSGMRVGMGDPAALGLKKHVRADRTAVLRRKQERYKRWDAGMEVSRRWKELKDKRRSLPTVNLEQYAAVANMGKSRESVVLSPPGFETTGTKVGLTLLIDFDDDPAAIPHAEIVDFCNGDGYTDYGNNGSVKEYFKDNSSGMLVYSNVVTVYIRIPNSLHPKSWYNDTTKDCGSQGNFLIRDAITIMTSLPNYNSEILPTFDALTVDGNNNVIAANIFYAGGNGGVWIKALWPHSWALYEVGSQELSPGGKKVFRYQITDIGASLELGTFCHENGHMLCGYPDIYDYEGDSRGGAGMFCLMNSGGHGTNPVQINTYLKRASGWGVVTELTSASGLNGAIQATTGSGINHFYRYTKPGTPTEYFLIENRQRTGRDANISASGLTVWHVDEFGDRDNQSLLFNTVHENYELTLVQADNLWHFQNNVNSGDANDLYFNGNSSSSYNNRLADGTLPHARWWDGAPSLLDLRNISSSADTMTFTVGPPLLPSPLLNAEPVITPGASNTITWSAGVVPAPLPLMHETDHVLDLASVTSTKDPLKVEVVTSDPGAAFDATDSNAMPRYLPPLDQPDTMSSGTFLFPESPDTEPLSAAPTIYNNTVGSSGYRPGANVEFLDFGTSSGGHVGSITIGYYTSLADPGTIQIEFRTGTTSTTRGTLLTNIAFTGLPGSSSPGNNQWFTLDLDLVADGVDFSLPAGSFGYAYIFDNADTGAMLAEGGSGSVDGVWLGGYYDNSKWEGAPWAGLYMNITGVEAQSSDLQVVEATLMSASAQEHNSFWTRARVQNAGANPAAASHAILWLSPGNDGDTRDDYLIGEVAVNALAAGDSGWVQWDFNMPDIVSGTATVWPVFSADSREAIPETNEANTFRIGSSVQVSDAPTLYYAECADNPNFLSAQTSGWIDQNKWTFTGLLSGQTNWSRVKSGQGPVGNRAESAWSNVETSINKAMRYVRTILGTFGTMDPPGVAATEPFASLEIEVVDGDPVTLTYSADTWYLIDSLFSNGIEVGAAAGKKNYTWEIASVTADVSNHITFAEEIWAGDNLSPLWWADACGYSDGAALSIYAGYLLNQENLDNPFEIIEIGVNKSNKPFVKWLSTGVARGTVQAVCTTNMVDAGAWSDVSGAIVHSDGTNTWTALDDANRNACYYLTVYE